MQSTTAAIPAALANPALQPTKVRWKIFLMMLFLISINYIDRASLSVAMPLIAKEFDIGPAVQGLLLSAFFWTYAFGQLPAGWFIDRVGVRIALTLAVGWWSMFTAATEASLVSGE